MTGRGMVRQMAMTVIANARTKEETARGVTVGTKWTMAMIVEMTT
jgi:hypothetical protein